MLLSEGIIVFFDSWPLISLKNMGSPNVSKIELMAREDAIYAHRNNTEYTLRAIMHRNLGQIGSRRDWVAHWLHYNSNRFEHCMTYRSEQFTV
jgi:hypothetical protein